MSVVTPPVPSQFYTQQANSQVYLSWLAMVGVTSYSVQRSTDGITFTTLASPTTAFYLDTTVVVNTQYYYQVAATNAQGTSPYTTPQGIIPTATGKMSLGQVRLLSQQRADRVNSQFVTLPEWNSYINQSYFELYDILVQKYGNEYFVAAPYQFTTTGDQFYDLPPLFYKELGLDLGLNQGQNAWLTLKRFNFIDRNTYLYPQLTTNLLGIAGLRYRIMGNQLELIPQPSAGQTMQLWYIPRMTELLKDTDVVDGISGWTEYIIVDAAIKALQKEESDVSVLVAQKMALLQRIESAAENRDAGEPDTISNTRRYGDAYGMGYGGSGPIGGV